MRALLLVLPLALNSFAASPLIFGARGGMSLTDNSNGLNALGSGFGLPSFGQQYAIGPTAGVRLPMGFSIEGDALFNRQSLDVGQFAGFSAATHNDSWEFPVMLKFTMGHHAIAPVVGAGVSVQHINNFGSVPSYLFSGSTSANSVGFVAGGGLRFQAGPVAITPEVRFTRWNSNSLAQALLSSFTGSQNEVQVMVGFTF